VTYIPTKNKELSDIISRPTRNNVSKNHNSYDEIDLFTLRPKPINKENIRITNISNNTTKGENDYINTKDFVKRIHNSEIFSHPGQKNTYLAAMHFSNMKYLEAAGKEVINECIVCKKTKNTNITKNLELMPIETAKERYQHLLTDLVGPIKDRDKSFLFQLMIDRFSRYTSTDPLETMGMAQKIFENIKKNLGTNIKDTKSITTNRGHQFPSHHWAETLKS
jgi:hypothetical protein